MSEPNKLLSIEDWSHNEGNGGAQEDVLVCITHNAGFRLVKDDAIVNPKAVNVEELLDGGLMRHIISDETVDRHGDVVRANGWDITNYKKNPVILWAHDHRQPPVGKSVRVIKRLKEKQLVSVGEYPSAELYEFGNTAFRLAISGFLSAVSVGFMPKEWKAINEEEPWNGYDISKQELWEYSIVPVPANPNALQNAANALPGGNAMVKRWAEQIMDMTPKEMTPLENLQDALHNVEGNIKSFIIDGMRFEPVKKQTIVGFVEENEPSDELREVDELAKTPAITSLNVLEPTAADKQMLELIEHFNKITPERVLANDITDWEREVIKRMSEKEDALWVNGTGVGTPVGIIHADTRDHDEDIKKRVEDKDDPVVLILSAEPTFNVEASVITNMVADAVTKVTGRLIDREV